MSASTHSGDSETNLMDSLRTLSDAGGAVLQVRTREPMRAIMAIRKHFVCGGEPYKEWDAINGVRAQFTNENYVDHKLDGNHDDLLAALIAPRGPDMPHGPSAGPTLKSMRRKR